MGEQQDSKLRKMMVAIDRIGSHVNSNTALRKLQNEEKAIEKQLTHLRRAERRETLERNKRVRSAMAALKKEHRETSKQVISLARRLDMHVHLDHAALRKDETIVTSKEVTAVKKLHAALRRLMSRLLRRPMAQFKEELSRAKVEGEHRV